MHLILSLRPCAIASMCDMYTYKATNATLLIILSRPLRGSSISVELHPISNASLLMLRSNTYHPKSGQAGCARTWSLYKFVSITVSAAVADMYPRRSNEPPGAVGGRYGSGCFHFSSRFSVSWISACSSPSVQFLMADAMHYGKGVVRMVDAPSAAWAL